MLNLKQIQHPSNNNKAAEMQGGKSVERQPLLLLLLLKLFYCLACLFQSAGATILFLMTHLKKLSVIGWKHSL